MTLGSIEFLNSCLNVTSLLNIFAGLVVLRKVALALIQGTQLST